MKKNGARTFNITHEALLWADRHQRSTRGKAPRIAHRGVHQCGLVVNVKAARVLALTIPPPLLL